MSKPVPEKVVAVYEDVMDALPVTSDLLPNLLEKYNYCREQEKKWAKKKADIGKEVFQAVDSVKVDTLVYVDHTIEMQWQATLVKPQPTEKLDEAKLRTAMMKLGKLDAALVEKILAASMKKGKKREPSVRISIGEIGQAAAEEEDNG